VTAPWHTLLDVAIRTTVVYLALLAGLRLTGTRQLGQMSTFDLVLLLIIANAVQNAMVGPDTSLAGGLVAASVLIAWHRLIDWWRLRSRGFAKLLAGEGIMLIHHGTMLETHLRRAGITRDEVVQALREHGAPDAGGPLRARGRRDRSHWRLQYRGQARRARSGDGAIRAAGVAGGHPRGRDVFAHQPRHHRCFPRQHTAVWWARERGLQ